MHYIILLLLIFIHFINGLKYKVINTSILGYFPSLKLHHIVVISNNNSNIYAIDFTPKKQESLFTQLKLLSFINVPGEIRIKSLKNVDFNDDDKLVNKWIQESKTPENSIFYDIELKKIMNQVNEEWYQYMNLYTHNCQHFSYYLKNKLLCNK
jgi:hypothetical protein